MKRLLGLIVALLLLPANGGLAASNIDGESTVSQCSEHPYTITVLNDTGNDINSIVITNTLPSTFSYVAGSTVLNTIGTTPACSSTDDPAPAASPLAWNIDSMCGGGGFILEDGGQIEVQYLLETDCNAVSGSNSVHVDYLMNGNPGSNDAGMSIHVDPGAVTITKSPSVQQASLGDTVTWTIEVENSGLGDISNVRVNDVLAAGLQYDFCSAICTGCSCSNAGQATTYTLPDTMGPGETVTVELSAIVTTCDNLENTADASWGCDPTTTCYDTAVDGGTATASIAHRVTSPLLEYNPPDITLSYCDDTPTPIQVIFRNVGDGNAYHIRTLVDFSPLNVTVTSPGAGYGGGLFSLPDIPAGGSYTLTFTLTLPDWCNASYPPSPLVWEKHYEDECGNDFYPPVELSNISPPTDVPSLTVDKSGPDEIQYGDTITYTITSSSTGTTSCGGGSAGEVMVTDTIPPGFNVVLPVPDGGVVSGDTVTWTYTPPNPLNTTLTIEVPLDADCADYCTHIIKNDITATGTDCCNCDLSANDSQSTAIECEDPTLVSSEKTAAPQPGVKCGPISYTNTYEFGASGTIILNDLVFTEQADNIQEYVSGTLATTLTGSGDITGCTTVTGNPPAGSPLVVDFSGCPGNSLVNQTLTISYDMTITEASVPACSDTEFYSWSSLNVGHNLGDCLADGIIHETTLVHIQAPSMDLSIGDLGAALSRCEQKEVTMVLSQNSDVAIPRDVQLQLSGLNYYIVDPNSVICTGSIQPVSCTPVAVGNDYVWDFGDTFTTAGAAATISMDVRKRCDGAGDLTATAFFDDLCTDDDIADHTCSVSASDAPAIILEGDLIISKTPEVYLALTNQVTWTIYLTNRGNGTAYGVWLDDVLGSGLLYDHATNPVVVAPGTGVTITPNTDHLGAPINGVSILIAEMAPGEKRTITLIAELINCTNLTNDVSASWGCHENNPAIDCQNPAATDHSDVRIPIPDLVYTGNIGSGLLDPCTEYDGVVTIKSAGQSSVYNITLEQSLPTGISYVPGSTQWRTIAGWQPGLDPSPDNPMTWTAAQIPGLASIDKKQKINIRYRVLTDCDWAGGDTTISGSYESTCGDVSTSPDRTFTISARDIDIEIEKRLITPEPVGCDEDLTWEIEVTNTSAITVPFIEAADTLGAAYSYVSATSNHAGDTVSQSGQVITWIIPDLAANASAILTLTARTDHAPCSPHTFNTVSAQWGCGTITSPLCLNDTQYTATHIPSREPDVTDVDFNFQPDTIDACIDETTLTLAINNTGGTSAFNTDLVFRLPRGLTYIPGSSEYYCGSAGPVATEPTVSGRTLTYYNIGNQAVNLCDELAAGESAVVSFDVLSSCFRGGVVVAEFYYYDCCGITQYRHRDRGTLRANNPELVVTKAPASGQVECGGTQLWNITVENTGSGNAQVIRILDTPGQWLVVDPSRSSAGLTQIGTTDQWGWEINDLAAGNIPDLSAGNHTYSQ